MAKSIDKQELVEVLKGARTVDMITPITKTKEKLAAVKLDAKVNKDAKKYLDYIDMEFRNQLKFLYEAANIAYPEDKVTVSHALSSLGPEQILEQYDFKIIVARKEV